jgi:hypothetical protein
VAPPYFVSETGWGSFEVGITLVLRDPSAPPIRLTHLLRLFPESGATAPNEKAVLYEH